MAGERAQRHRQRATRGAGYGVGVQLPETCYVERPDGVNLAHQVIGEGTVTLAFCSGFISHLDLQWTDPGATRFFRRLSSFCRVVLFDKAGTGLSDPIRQVATLEQRAEDIRIVMDAVGVERVALFGESEGGPSAMLFAATHPERCSALILYGSLVKGLSDDPESEPWALSPAVIERYERLVQNWGKGLAADLFIPSKANPAVRRVFGTFERAAVSPSMARALLESVKALDVSTITAAISVPTLVLHRRGDLAVPIACGRHLAATIPGAQYVELDGADHAYQSGEFDQILDAAERFLTGGTTALEPSRVLTTILFTDIVDSTRRAARVGDSAWKEILERHVEVVRTQVEKAEGRVVKLLGDGSLCTFPGPARAIRCAQEIIDQTQHLDLALRAGIHTGECERIGDDIGGMAVHIAARVAAIADPGDVLVSSTVKDLVIGSGLTFQDRGEHELKGVPDAWHVYSVGAPAEARVPLEPAAANMTRTDRATVLLAHRAPGAIRALARFTQRGR